MGNTSEATLSLMGAVSSGVSSNVLQPVLLDGSDNCQAAVSQSAGDKSPLPELTQLSSHGFRGKHSHRHRTEYTQISSRQDGWLPCRERSYFGRPYAIKNQRGASKIPPSRGLWMNRAGSLWHKTACEAIARNNPPHGGGPVWSWGLFLLVEINNLAGVQSRDTSRTSHTGCQTHL